MEIIEYKGVKDILVRFCDDEYATHNGYTVHTNYYSFTIGHVNSQYDKTVYGVGYWGVGRYNLSDEDGKMLPQYNTWKSMLQRCYSESFHKNNPSYIGCSVIKEWHNYQTFAKWYDENHYIVDGFITHLDKDILIKGNRVYGPDTCIFTPDFINVIFVKTRAKLSNLPVGVSLNRTKTKYSVKCGIGSKNPKYLGQFSTPEKAFNAYKEFKEKYIKQVADKFKDRIPKILYDAMYKYIVETTD